VRLLPGNMGCMTERRYVAHETTDGIAHVRLIRPDKLNALTLETLDELVATARELRRDRSLRAVVLSGEGTSFCAGLDFGSAMKSPAGIAKAFVPLPWRGTNTFQEAAWAWRRLPVPVIAAIEGHCYGGGLQLALACDIRVAAPDAQFRMAEPALGLVPDLGGTQPLVEAVGYARALEICATGRSVDAAEAAELGLATVVVPAAEMPAAVDDLTAALTAAPHGAVTGTKRLLQAAPRQGYDEQRAAERREQIVRLRDLAAQMPS